MLAWLSWFEQLALDLLGNSIGMLCKGTPRRPEDVELPGGFNTKDYLIRVSELINKRLVVVENQPDSSKQVKAFNKLLRSFTTDLEDTSTKKLSPENIFHLFEAHPLNHFRLSMEDLLKNIEIAVSRFLHFFEKNRCLYLRRVFSITLGAWKANIDGQT